MLAILGLVAVMGGGADELPKGWDKIAAKCSGWAVAEYSYQIAPLKPDGRQWDGDNSPPDVSIAIIRKAEPNRKIALPQEQDHLAGQGRPKKEILLGSLEGEFVASVVDTDALLPDGIGSVPLAVEVLAESPKKAGMLLARLYGTGGAVEKLEIVVGLTGAGPGTCPSDVLVQPLLKMACETRQIEARVNLKGAFTAVTSFKAEQNHLPMSLEQAGWAPERGVRYAYSFEPMGAEFAIRAVANIDGDEDPDVWELRGAGEPHNKQNDCQKVSSVD